MSAYESLAACYDELTYDIRYEKTLTFFERLCAREHVQPHLVLDLACGTGSCAALVAANLCGLAGREAEIELDGGTLLDRWDEQTGRVLMTGPAAFVFDGEYEA